MDIQGYPWISMDIHGHPWISIDFQGLGEPASVSWLMGEPLGRGTLTQSFIQKVGTPSGKPGRGKLES